MKDKGLSCYSFNTFIDFRTMHYSMLWCGCNVSGLFNAPKTVQDNNLGKRKEKEKNTKRQYNNQKCFF